jgi:hypothetical protein
MENEVTLAKVEIFLLFTRLYDAAASSASPLGSAASLATGAKAPVGNN